MIKLPEMFFEKQERPFFIYDPTVIENNINVIATMFPYAKNLFYSVKANPNPSLIKFLLQRKMNFDVSSEAELRHVLQLKVPPSSITFSGPAKTKAALALAVQSGICSVHLDSYQEFLEVKDSQQPFTVRLPLDDAFSKKLGIPFKQVHDILSNCQQRVKGFHIYVGRERASQALVEKYKTEIESLILKYPKAFSGQPEVFWGAGLPPAAFLNENDYQNIPQSQLFLTHLEAGRTFVHDCGWYGVRVLARKSRESGELFIIDGGLQNVATYFSSPKFGQERLRVQFFSPIGEPKLATAGNFTDIYGSLGIWNDLMIRKIETPKSLKRNDWMLINPAGAYGWTASTNQFIGPQFCDEYLLVENKLERVSPKDPMSYLESGIYENSTNR